MDRKKVKVWACKIIVSEDSELPNGFDYPPRMAAIEAVEVEGIKVLGCSSGWGGTITENEEDAFNSMSSGIYYAGVVDGQEGGAH